MKIYYFLLIILYQNCSSMEENNSIFRSLDEYLITYNPPLKQKLKRCFLSCWGLCKGVFFCQWCKKKNPIENRSSFNDISEGEIKVEQHTLIHNNKILTFFLSQKK